MAGLSSYILVEMETGGMLYERLRKTPLNAILILYSHKHTPKRLSSLRHVTPEFKTVRLPWPILGRMPRRGGENIR